MDILHRISVNTSDKDFLSLLEEIDVKHIVLELPGNGGTLVTVVITESHPHWIEFIQAIQKQKLFKLYKEGDLFETIFSDDEIRDAEWLRLRSTFERGYPQPKMSWPIKQSSYQILCPNCAIYQQTHPMRIAKEPYLGKMSFMTLIWTPEILCLPIVANALQETGAEGFEVWDVLLHKTSQPSEKLRQIFVSNIASPGILVDDDLQRKLCPVCGTIKYYQHVKGVMQIKRQSIPHGIDFVLTHEWFGHGYLAWREILVSNRVARFILDKGWQGVRFKVVELI